jgi:hypothetical protein
MTATRRATLSTFAVLVGLCAFDVQAAPNRIDGVRVSAVDEGTIIEIAGQYAPNFTTFRQDSPKRVIVDVAESQLHGVPGRIHGDGRLVKNVTTSQIGEYPHGISRVIIALAKEAEYRITTRGGSLLVQLSPGTGGLMVSAGVPISPTFSSNRRQEIQLPLEITPPPDADRAHAHALPIEDENSPNDPDEPRDPEFSEPQTTVKTTRGQKPIRLAMVDKKTKPVRRIQPRSQPVNTQVAQAQEPEPVDEEDQALEEPDENMGNEDTTTEDLPPSTPPPPAVEESEVDDTPPPPPAVEEVTADAEPDPMEFEDRLDASATLKHMTWMGFQQTMESSRVFIKTNAPVRFHVTEEGDDLVVLELENTRIPLRNNRRFLDTHFFDTAITMITPREIEGASRNVRIEIQIKSKVPYTSGQDDNMVYLDFQRP